MTEPSLSLLSSGNLIMAYLVTYEMRAEVAAGLDSPHLIDRLRPFVDGLYIPALSEMHSFREAQPRLLGKYKTEMYERRFRRGALEDRQSVVVEINGLEAAGLASRTEELLGRDNTLELTVTNTAHKMGVGCLTLWMRRRSGRLAISDAEKLRDLSNVRTSIDWRLGPEGKYVLSGVYSLEEISRFLIVYFFCAMEVRLRATKATAKFVQKEDPGAIHRWVCECLGEKTCSDDIDVYPIFHLDLSVVSGASASAVHELVGREAAKLRGLVTGDANWDKKKTAMVQAFVDAHQFSTRTSIEWFTHPNGSLKIYSADLETDLLTSQVLIAFELEMIVTMRHFLYKLVRNLHRFSGQPYGRYPLRSVSRLRDEELRRLDDFYNLDLLQKDTTASRVERFRQMFKVDEILAVADKKFETLATYMSTEFQSASAIRQLWLTIIFGVFGAGSLTLGFIRQVTSGAVVDLSLTRQVAMVSAVMIGCGAIIYVVFRGTRLD